MEMVVFGTPHTTQTPKSADDSAEDPSAKSPASQEDVWPTESSIASDAPSTQHQWQHQHQNQHQQPMWSSSRTLERTSPPRQISFGPLSSRGMAAAALQPQQQPSQELQDFLHDAINTESSSLQPTPHSDSFHGMHMKTRQILMDALVAADIVQNPNDHEMMGMTTEQLYTHVRAAGLALPAVESESWISTVDPHLCLSPAALQPAALRASSAPLSPR